MIYRPIESEGIKLFLEKSCERDNVVFCLAGFRRDAYCVMNMQVHTALLRGCILLLISLGIAIIIAYVYRAHIHRVHRAKPHAKPHIDFAHPEINWHAIRHMWLG
jgi:hypothetical protein